MEYEDNLIQLIDEDGEELSIGERLRAESHEFLPRPVFFCPLCDVEFFHSQTGWNHL